MVEGDVKLEGLDIRASAVIETGRTTNRVKAAGSYKHKRCCGTRYGLPHGVGCPMAMAKEAAAERQAADEKPPGPPGHYKVICISMYTSDLKELDRKLALLRARGWSKANRSQLIRIALAELDAETMPVPRL